MLKRHGGQLESESKRLKMTSRPLANRPMTSFFDPFMEIERGLDRGLLPYG